MLRWRLITAAVAIPFLLWMIYRGPIWFLNAFVLSMTFIARWKRDTGIALTPRDVVLNDLASIAKLSDGALVRSDRNV